VLSAAVAGLVVSGGPLAFDGRWLQGGFFARYALVVAAIRSGGAILSVLLFDSITLLDERQPTPQGSAILFYLASPSVAGGILGIFEGVCLGLPLAWLLGLSGNRAAARGG
jgi:hypothetical protein